MLTKRLNERNDHIIIWSVLSQHRDIKAPSINVWFFISVLASCLFTGKPTEATNHKDLETDWSCRVVGRPIDVDCLPWYLFTRVLRSIWNVAAASSFFAYTIIDICHMHFSLDAQMPVSGFFPKSLFSSYCLRSVRLR